MYFICVELFRLFFYCYSIDPQSQRAAIAATGGDRIVDGSRRLLPRPSPSAPFSLLLTVCWPPPTQPRSLSSLPALHHRLIVVYSRLHRRRQRKRPAAPRSTLVDRPRSIVHPSSSPSSVTLLLTTPVNLRRDHEPSAPSLSILAG